MLLSDLFRGNIDHDDETGCDIWLGDMASHGPHHNGLPLGGSVRHFVLSTSGTRASKYVTVGARCKNDKCVNPNHLYIVEAEPKAVEAKIKTVVKETKEVEAKIKTVVKEVKQEVAKETKEAEAKIKTVVEKVKQEVAKETKEAEAKIKTVAEKVKQEVKSPKTAAKTTTKNVKK